MNFQQTPEESLSGSAIPLGLEKYINHFTIPKALAALMGQALLVDGCPQIVLFSINFDEDFIDVECVAITSVLSLQSSGI